MYVKLHGEKKETLNEEDIKLKCKLRLCMQMQIELQNFYCDLCEYPENSFVIHIG